MKKHIATLLCAVGLMLYTAVPALAAGTYYPISVTSGTMGSADTPCIQKVYQLSLSDDPAGIPTGDFEQYGYRYHLMDLTQSHDVGVDTQTKTDTITRDSDTGELAEVLKQLDGQKDVKTADGYVGTLILDPASVSVKAKGYATSTRNLSASRTYPNLSDADLSLVPKTVSDGGRTLNLANVQWSSEYQEDGGTHYTANATYAGTVTSQYATGYTVTATYTGVVSKTNCEIATYTAIFLGEKIEPEQETDSDSEAEPEPVPEDAAPVDTAPEEADSAKQDTEPVPDAEPAEGIQDGGSSVPAILYVLGAAGCLGFGGGLAAVVYTFKQNRKTEGGDSQ